MQPDSQLWNQCNFRHLMIKFLTNAKQTCRLYIENIARGTMDPEYWVFNLNHLFDWICINFSCRLIDSIPWWVCCAMFYLKQEEGLGFKLTTIFQIVVGHPHHHRKQDHLQFWEFSSTKSKTLFVWYEQFKLIYTRPFLPEWFSFPTIIRISISCSCLISPLSKVGWWGLLLC